MVFVNRPVTDWPSQLIGKDSNGAYKVFNARASPQECVSESWEA